MNLEQYLKACEFYSDEPVFQDEDGARQIPDPDHLDYIKFLKETVRVRGVYGTSLTRELADEVYELRGDLRSVIKEVRQLRAELDKSNMKIARLNWRA